MDYLREVLSDIGAVLEFQVIGCDAIGQRNPGKYRNPGGRNRTKIRLGEICQISPRHLHFQPKERVEGGLFTEYWLSHQSRSASQEGGENVFLRQWCEANGAQAQAR